MTVLPPPVFNAFRWAATAGRLLVGGVPAAIAAVFVVLILFVGLFLSERRQKYALNAAKQVIELMLALNAKRADLKRKLDTRRSDVDDLHTQQDDGDSSLDPYVSCFVAMSFGDPRAAEIYDAVRAVLEARPYYWAVVRADDTVEQPDLWANLKAKLLPQPDRATPGSEPQRPGQR
jgi:hypothetical protein